ncbi:pentapeptide repeat-containing protein [Trichocoleus sp. FACHB-262]|uniref:pentapeptide repeat-containing protein n=1 Tax=Trichocoleus sp. FACHB-262 TaxID=2692869 RepID=UPI001683CB52|nr:pentapeptide repeat-containing protein [Trichocoleus sp. FACHB-262]MBD2123520.1 pentapeptide repeat-containing protein [Trichocoleus sp. FACHB-262]
MAANNNQEVKMQPGQKSFCNRNLSGQSFKGQNLSEADFSNADIRGGDFSSANLTGVNFSGAKAGLQKRCKLILTIAASALSGLAGFTTVLAAFWIAFQLTYQLERLPTSLVFFSIVLVIFFVVNAYKGLLAAIGSVPLAVAIITPVAGVVTAAGTGHPTAGGSGAGIAAVTIAGAVVSAIAITGARVAVGTWSAALVVVASVLGMSVAANTAQGEATASILYRAVGKFPQIWVGARMALATIVTETALSLFIAWRTLAGDQRYTFINRFAIAFAATGGTDFREANLTNANFSDTNLKNSDFRGANITRTCWHRAKNLVWARVEKTILADSAVQDLLVSGNGHQQSYANANLQGANLIGADLRYANFKGAHLNRATLQGACLEWANLTQAQAIGVDFTNAQMTGACGLGTWNIDNSTNLERITCRWVYLLETPKPGTDDRERRPHSGEFAPGEFTSLFREVLDTVDLIFRNGFNWIAFSQSLRQVQVENKGVELEIQSIENKGNGVVVVKVKTPIDANKGVLHNQFMQFYHEAIALLEQHHEGLDRHERELQSIRSLLSSMVRQPTPDSPVVILNIGQGDFNRGFPVTLQILQDGTTLPSVQSTGELPPNVQILQDYQYWRSAYRRSLKATRLDVPSQVTNVSKDEFFSDCLAAAKRLSQQLNLWLSSEPFREIERKIQLSCSGDQRIRMILQTDHPQLRQLPWQSWRFFEDYTHAELALSKLNYRALSIATNKKSTANAQVKILAILGDSRGIDLQKDKATLNTLAAEVTFLVEPQRQELSEKLWDQHWDILFFAGHSRSQTNGSTGSMQINRDESLEISDLRNALMKAISRGLKLAIFNSCDGLGLANAFADLQIPQMIVMRESVPDPVAQAFLTGFLKEFSDGQPLYQAVRKARERLQDLEDQYPCATWLPVIVQNPAEIPPTWDHM